MDIHALEYYSVMKSKEKSDTCYNMVDHSVQLSHSVVSESLQPCSTPGFPVHHQPLELAQTHVHQVGDATQPSHPLSSPSPLILSLSQHQGLFNESALSIRWAKYWSFSFSISSSNEFSGLVSFRMDWFDLLAVHGTVKSLFQHHSGRFVLTGQSWEARAWPSAGCYRNCNRLFQLLGLSLLSRGSQVACRGRPP